VLLLAFLLFIFEDLLTKAYPIIPPREFFLFNFGVILMMLSALYQALRNRPRKVEGPRLADARLQKIVAWRWLGAVVAYALIGSVVEFPIYAVSDLAHSANAGVPARNIALYGTALATGAVDGAAAGFLTAWALRARLTSFPIMAWCFFYVAASIIGSLSAASDPTIWNPGKELREIAGSSKEYVDAVLIFLGIAFAGGLLIGAIAGGLQALVLRRVAIGLGGWVIGWSLAISVMGPLMFILALTLPPKDTMLSRIAYEVQGIVVLAITAFLLLPAVASLKPRSTG
jgi:hypothetical protein